MSEERMVMIENRMTGKEGQEIRWIRYTPVGRIGERSDETLTLVCIPGMGHQPDCWTALMIGCAEAGIPAYAVGYRGHTANWYDKDESKLLKRSHHLDAVTDIEAFLDHEGLRSERCIFVGHSLGGALAQLLAQRNPVAGLVLIATSDVRDQQQAANHLLLHHPFIMGNVIAHPKRPMLASKGARRVLMLGRTYWTKARDSLLDLYRSAEIGHAITDMRKYQRGKGVYAYKRPQTESALVIACGRDAIYPAKTWARLPHWLHDQGIRAEYLVLPDAPHDVLFVDDFFPAIEQAIVGYVTGLEAPLGRGRMDDEAETGAEAEALRVAIAIAEGAPE